ncbi:MAG TPA: DUF433 domain-containing protein [Acidimicrobiia bacterium]|nr:DUF433 domain-containing protein [Acidimicrobiia bacterium]
MFSTPEGEATIRKPSPAALDLRFCRPLYTPGEAARFLSVPESTLRTWAGGYERRHPSRRPTVSGPILTTLPGNHGVRIPFVGLVEGMVAAGFRSAGVSMQHIRRALSLLQEELGIEHALASQKLYTDGAAILYDFARIEAEDLLTVVVTGQRVFTGAIKQYLERIHYAPDRWADRLVLPITSRQLVEVDPTRAFGRPVFVKGGARMEDVLGRFRAGEPLADVAHDFDLDPLDVEDVIRAALPVAA